MSEHRERGSSAKQVVGGGGQSENPRHGNTFCGRRTGFQHRDKENARKRKTLPTEWFAPEIHVSTGNPREKSRATVRNDRETLLQPA